MLLIRNPWGETGWSGNWNFADAAWTADYISQVPHGIDPTNRTQSFDDGIMFMEDIDFMTCFDDF